MATQSCETKRTYCEIANVIADRYRSSQTKRMCHQQIETPGMKDDNNLVFRQLVNNHDWEDASVFWDQHSNTDTINDIQPHTVVLLVVNGQVEILANLLLKASPALLEEICSDTKPFFEYIEASIPERTAIDVDKIIACLDMLYSRGMDPTKYVYRHPFMATVPWRITEWALTHGVNPIPGEQAFAVPVDDTMNGNVVRFRAFIVGTPSTPRDLVHFINAGDRDAIQMWRIDNGLIPRILPQCPDVFELAWKSRCPLVTMTLIENIDPFADLNTKVTGSDHTLLWIAAVEGTPRHVKMLLERKADPNILVNNGYGPESILHALVRQTRDIETFELLLAAGANPSVLNRDNMTPAATMVSMFGQTLSTTQHKILGLLTKKSQPPLNPGLSKTSHSLIHHSHNPCSSPLDEINIRLYQARLSYATTLGINLPSVFHRKQFTFLELLYVNNLIRGIISHHKPN